MKISVVIAVALMCELARADSPMNPSAKEHLDKGLELYRTGDYDGATAAFRLGYAIDARPEFLYALAQAKRMSGDCHSAVGLYEQFLGTSPSELQADVARRNIERCKAAEPPPEMQVPAPTPIIDKPAIIEKQAKPKDRSPWYKDIWGGALVGSGVVALGVGAGFLAAAKSAESNAREEMILDDYNAGIDRAKGRQTIGFVAIAAGSALVVGGVARYLLRTP